jgi:hypothetical protein
VQWVPVVEKCTSREGKSVLLLEEISANVSNFSKFLLMSFKVIPKFLPQIVQQVLVINKDAGSLTSSIDN